METEKEKQYKERGAALLLVQDKAVQLFEEIERDLIRPGMTEKALSDAIHALGEARHGVRTHWHKRIVRSGPNTLCPFAENGPDRVIGDDDILVLDLGPVFEEWEADFGRTYVLGNGDPAKLRLRDAVEPMWLRVRDLYRAGPASITGEELYAMAKREAERDGWEFGSQIAGHIVGVFPHERIPRDMISLYIAEGCNTPLNSEGKDGQWRHWILEIHLRDPVNQIQGFYEQLLTV